ncbi:MAG: hypothetical protein ACK5RO_04320 [Pseudobdellovibrionaceae bacterium]
MLFGLKNSKSKSILMTLLVAILAAGCAFKKDNGNDESENKSPNPPQVKEVPRGVLKAKVSPNDSRLHVFDIELNWNALESCNAQIKQLNLDNGSSMYLQVTEQSIEKKKVLVTNLPEGTKFQFELSCLGYPIPFVEAVQVRTPFDLSIDNLVDEEELQKRGIIDSRSSELRIVRLRIGAAGILQLSDRISVMKFSSADFIRGSRIINHKQEALTFLPAQARGLLGQSGASLEFLGNLATGHLNLDLRGYPGKEGEPGRDRAADELPTTPKNGESASFKFEGAPTETFEECAQRRADDLTRPRGRGDRLSAYRRCNILRVTCEKEATDGESFRGLPGGPGQMGKQGGSSGKVVLKINDISNLLIKAVATPGEGGPQGVGGQGGSAPNVVTQPGSTSFIPQLKTYLNWPQDMSDEEVMRRIDRRWEYAKPCSYQPKHGQNLGQGFTGESQNPQMQGPRGEVEDVMVWESSVQGYRAIRPTLVEPK